MGSLDKDKDRKGKGKGKDILRRILGEHKLCPSTNNHNIAPSNSRVVPHNHDHSTLGRHCPVHSRVPLGGHSSKAHLPMQIGIRLLIRLLGLGVGLRLARDREGGRAQRGEVGLRRVGEFRAKVMLALVLILGLVPAPHQR